MVEDYIAIFIDSEVLQEPIEISISNPSILTFLRIELHKAELDIIQGRLESGDYDSWPEEKRKAKTFIRKLEKELGSLRRQSSLERQYA